MPSVVRGEKQLSQPADDFVENLLKRLNRLHRDAFEIIDESSRPERDYHLLERHLIGHPERSLLRLLDIVIAPRFSPKVKSFDAQVLKPPLAKDELMSAFGPSTAQLFEILARFHSASALKRAKLELANSVVLSRYSSQDTPLSGARWNLSRSPLRLQLLVLAELANDGPVQLTPWTYPRASSDPLALFAAVDALASLLAVSEDYALLEELRQPWQVVFGHHEA